MDRSVNVMGSFFNRSELKERRRSLRNNATPAEQQLWGSLKGRGLCEFKFRRQHSIGPYIVDFYCPEKRLAVELDGAVHENELARERDRRRDAFLEQHGIRVLRFPNDAVFERPEQMLSEILQALQAR